MTKYGLWLVTEDYNRRETLSCDEQESILNALAVYLDHLDEQVREVQDSDEKIKGIDEAHIVDLAPMQREVMTETRTMAYDLRVKLVQFIGRDLTELGC